MSAFSIFSQVLGLLAFGAKVGILVLLLKHFKKKYIWFFILYVAIPYLSTPLYFALLAARVLSPSILVPTIWGYLSCVLLLLGAVFFFRERRRQRYNVL